MKRSLSLILMILMFSLPGVAAKKHPGRVEILVDASASMASSFGRNGSDRLGAIRTTLDVLAVALKEEQPDQQIALRVFGGHASLADADACEDTELLLNWSPASEAALNTVLDDIGSRGASPLGAALDAVKNDFGAIDENDGLLVILDGLDSCGDGEGLGILDEMQEQGLKVLVMGLGLATDDRTAIEAHAPLKSTWDLNGFISAVLNAVVGLGPAETAGLSTQFLLENKTGGEKLKLRSTMISGVNTVPAENFPLNVTVPAGSLSARVVDESGQTNSVLLRIPSLPGHRVSLDFPQNPPADLEVTEMPDGWEIRPSLEVEYRGAPPDGARLVLQNDPSPGASWVFSMPITASEGRTRIPLPERSGDYLLQLRTREDQEERVLAELQLKAPGRRVTIEAPTEARSDSSIPVQWEGIAQPGDFLTIVPADSPYESIGKIFPASDGLSFDLPPVGDVCAWEIRYFSGLSNLKLAGAKIEIKDPLAGILVPEEAEVSRKFEVRFFGPRHDGDILSLSAEDAAATDYISWATTETEPATLEAPSEPGSYLLRYVGSDGEILAEEPIEIKASKVLLTAPDSVTAGARIEISWTGERSPEDYITIAHENAPLSRKISFVYASMGSPTSLAAPEQKGTYEIRYISGHEILARRSIRVE